MEMLNKEEKDKLDEIVKYITESSDYKKMIKYKEKVSENKELLDLINEVKSLQKKYIRSKKEENIKKELDSKISLLEKYDEFVIYNYYLDKVNTNLELVKEKINNYFDKLFNEELI